jgi:hypothetical protein
MRTKVLLAVTGVGVLLAAGATPVLAHHAFSAEFDDKKPITLQGTITRMEWVNPHVWIHFDVKRPDGKVDEWMIEGGTPNTLFRRGFTKLGLQPGTAIKVDGYQARDGSKKGNGRTVTFSDGKTLFLGSSGTGAPADGRDATEPPKR